MTRIKAIETAALAQEIPEMSLKQKVNFDWMVLRVLFNGSVIRILTGKLPKDRPKLPSWLPDIVADLIPEHLRLAVRKLAFEALGIPNPADVYAKTTENHPAVRRGDEVVITGHELIAAVAQAEKEHLVRRLSPDEGGHVANVLGKSSLTTPDGEDLEEGGQDREERQNLSRATAAPLNPKSIGKMVSAIQDIATTQVQKLVSEKEAFDLVDDTTEFSLMVLMSMLFGNDISNDYIDKIRPLWVVINRETSKLNVSGREAKPSNVLRKATEELDAIVTELIGKEKNRTEEAHTLVYQLTHPDSKTPKLTDEQLKGTIKALFFAGHETTSLALAWTLHMIFTNPEIESKVFAEIREKLKQKPSKQFTAADYKDLKYTLNTCSEGMRLKPPIWATIPRIVNKNTMIGGYKFYKGDRLVVQIAKDHLNPEIWPDAEQAIPERFNNLTEAQKSAFEPFYKGAHICPGRHLADQEMLAFLVSMVETGVKLEEVEKPKIFASLTQAPVWGIMMQQKKSYSAQR